MKKVFTILIAIVLVVAFLPVSGAQAAVPTKYESSIQLRNLTNATGNIAITFFALDGSTAATVADTIAPYATNSYYQSSMPVDAGFNGSVVVSSDVPTAGMSNLVGLDGASQSVSYAAFAAFDQGSTNVFLPTLFANNYGYNTFFYVQNLGSVAADVAIAYSDGKTATVTGIQPGASKVVKQAAEGHSVTVFSATATSAQPIAITVVEEGPTLFAYDGFGGGALLPIMPLVNENNYGYFTGIQIQNAGSAPTDVTVSYTPAGAGTACTEKRTIAAGASKTFAQFVFYTAGAADASLTENCAMGERFVGSAAVTVNSGNQPLVAVVNQLHIADNKGGAYGAFDPAAGNSQVIYPLIMDRNYGYFTSWSLVNVGTTPIAADAISCLVTGKSGATDVTKTIKNPVAIAPGASWTLNHDGVIANAFVGGATCSAPGGKLVGTSNQLGAGASWAGIDTLLVSEGFVVAGP